MGEPSSTRASLLVRIRDPRDGPAWAEFVEIYTPLLHRLALRRGLQEADAADLVQEVFRCVAGAIGRWDPDPARGSFRGWLFRIARNLICDLLAAQGRHPRGSGDTDVRLLLERWPAPAPDEAGRFEAEYRRRLFDWAAGRVRGEFREPSWRAFWSTAVEGRRPQEAAEALGISVGAVYIARSRVMARLRETIEGVEGTDLGPEGSASDDLTAR